MSTQASLWDLPSAISLQESASGATRSDSRDGLTNAQSGPEVVPALPSQLRAKERGLQTLVTSGRYGSILSASVDLERSLANRLMARLDTAGSTLFQQTWKRKSTPLRRQYWAHTARGLPTSVKGCTSLPTARATDGEKNVRRLEGALREIERKGGVQDLCQAAMLASVPTPTCDDPKHVTRDSGQFQSLTQPARLASVPTPQMMDTLPPMEYEKRLNHPSGPGRTACGNMREVSTLQNVASSSGRDWKDTSGMSESGVDPDGSTRSRLDQLPRQAQLAASGLTAIGGTDATESTDQLDPEYSRWLMGLPPEWSSCAVTAMQSVSQRRKSSSKRTSTRKDRAQ